MEDTSLDDFVSADRATAAEDEPDGAAEAAERGSEPSSTASDVGPSDVSDASPAVGADAGTGTEGEWPEQPTVTAAWSGDAAPCPECGEPSAWRWAQAGAMVCPACKEW
jgi:hypothetical protein